MFKKLSLIPLLMALAVVSGLLSTAALAFGTNTEQVLYNFCPLSGCEDGLGPVAGLVFDSVGDLYGTTNQGGDYNYGAVFELTPNGEGSWTETALYSFCPVAGCADGAYPSGTLVFDTSGNLYGTTPAGGSKASDGTVFKLTPGANGHWTETVIHSFMGRSGGSEPLAGLLFDHAGNLYGATLGGPPGSGCHGCGLIFELKPGADGEWKEKVLHSFKNNGKDGVGPTSGLVFDASGNLYGTTTGGGTGACQYGGSGCGTVFELTPGANGKWTEKVLYSFRHNHKDGTGPTGSVAMDTGGSLYGTTQLGGTGSGSGCKGQVGYGCGTVFKLTPGANGEWTEKVLHNFTFNGRDGIVPFAGVVFGAAGILFGTTELGGANDSGIVFELTSGSNGKWTERVLYSFCSVSGCTDGARPLDAPIFDTFGNLYGTTASGGASGQGTVFEITP